MRPMTMPEAPGGASLHRVAGGAAGREKWHEQELGLDPLGQYLQEIGKIALLNGHEEEAALSERIEAGVFAETLLALSEPETPEETRTNLLDSLRVRYQSDTGSADEDKFMLAVQQWRSLASKDLREAAQDGKKAFDTFLTANLQLVVSIAKRKVGHGLELLDLIEEGNLGLSHAIKKFDYTKGFKFSTYATSWIKKSIDKGIAEGGRTIILGKDIHDEVNQLQRKQRDLRTVLDRKPSVDELAKELGKTPARVADLIGWGRETTSLDIPAGEQGESTMTIGDLVLEDGALPVQEIVLHSIELETLQQVLAALTDEERLLLTHAYGLGEHKILNQTRLALLFPGNSKAGHLSREAVQLWHTKLLAKLREAMMGMDQASSSVYLKSA